MNGYAKRRHTRPIKQLSSNPNKTINHMSIIHTEMSTLTKLNMGLILHLSIHVFHAQAYITTIILCAYR